MNSIWLLLGLKPEGFRSGLKRSADDVKSFQKDWKMLSRIFAAGGLTSLVTGFFTTTIAHAREAKREFGENYEAVRRFGTSLDDAKKTGGSWGVELLGWINRAGEAMGGLWQMTLGATRARDEFVGAKAANDAELAERSLAKAMKHESEFKQITATIKSETEKIAEARTRSLTVQEQLNVRYNEEAKIQMKIINYEGDKLGFRKLEAEYAVAKTRTQEAQIAVAKEQAEISKKGFEQDLEWVKAQDKLQAEKQKLQFEAKSAAEQITTLERSQLALRHNINQARADGEETLQMEVDLLGVTAELTKLRAEQAEKVAEAEERAAKAAKEAAVQAAVLAKAKSDLAYAIGHGGATSEEIGEASPAALAEMLRRNNAAIARLRNDSSVNPAGQENLGVGWNLARLMNENARIQRELDARNQFSNNYNFLGPEAARRNFKGDPLLFDRLVQEWVTGRNESQKHTNLLEQISRQIGGTSVNGVPTDMQSISRQLAKGVPLIVPGGG